MSKNIVVLSGSPRKGAGCGYLIISSLTNRLSICYTAKGYKIMTKEANPMLRIQHINQIQGFGLIPHGMAF